MADVLARLAADLERAASLPSRVAQLADVARGALGADGVGLMLLDDEDRLRLVVASDHTAAALEESQLQTGAGPGIDCIRLDRAVARSPACTPSPARTGCSRR